jgi:hypothetical protein
VIIFVYLTDNIIWLIKLVVDTTVVTFQLLVPVAAPMVNANVVEVVEEAVSTYT